MIIVIHSDHFRERVLRAQVHPQTWTVQCARPHCCEIEKKKVFFFLFFYLARGARSRTFRGSGIRSAAWVTRLSGIIRCISLT